MGTILAISSSPRRMGNSELLLQSFGLGIEEEGDKMVQVRVNDLKINYCQACDGCAPTGKCILQDDMQEIYPQVASAKGMVLATPIYFGGMSSQLKKFIDRFQCWWQAKYNLNKPQVALEEERPGYFLCVGALEKKAYCENALSIAKVYFHNVNYKYSDCLCYRGVDEKGVIKDHSHALQDAFEAGRYFALQSSPDTRKS